jgi:hypothetical protein
VLARNFMSSDARGTPTATGLPPSPSGCCSPTLGEDDDDRDHDDDDGGDDD